LAPQIDHVILQLFEPRRIGAEERVVVHRLQGFGLQHQGPELRQISLNAHAEALAQIFTSDRARRDTHYGFARRRPATATIVAEAIFLLIGVVSVPGAEAILDLVVVARTLIGVLDHHADRRAGGAALEHPRQDLHLIRLLALAGVPRRPGAPALELRLNVRLGQLQPRRATIDDAAERGPMAFAEGGDGEELA